MLKGYSSTGLKEIWQDYRDADKSEDNLLDLSEVRMAIEVIRDKFFKYHLHRGNL